MKKIISNNTRIKLFVSIFIIASALIVWQKDAVVEIAHAAFPAADYDFDGNVSVGANNGASFLELNDIAGAKWRLYTGNYGLSFWNDRDADGTYTQQTFFDTNGNLFLGSEAAASLVHLNDIPGAKWQIRTGNYGLSFWNDFNADGTYTQQVFVDHNGNVGIGTTTPQSKLAVNGDISVNGKIEAGEVIVEVPDAGQWPDYVFAPDYELMPLDEVEAYITKYRHLPGVPAAEEIAEHGASVGATQIQLLEKVEELTLHLIEMDKRIDELEAQNKELKEALSATK